MAHSIRQRTPAAPPEGARPVPLALWDGEPAVLLGPADDPAVLQGRLASISVIAIEFPQFTDGRGYSIARLLRERYGYTGELRAVGEVLRDNLFYLSRCGFDAFEVSDPSGTEALGSLADFSEGYQASVERPLPLYRRRFA